MIEKLRDIWDDYWSEITNTNGVMIGNVVYASVSFVMCLFMIFVIKSNEDALVGLVENILSETNYIFALFFMSESGNNNDFTGVIIIPVLYVFLCRIIYRFLDTETLWDHLLQLVGNCFLQIYLAMHISAAPEKGTTTVAMSICCIILGIGTVSLVIALIKAPNPFLVIPKFFKYLFYVPILRDTFAVEIAFLAPAILILVLTCIFEIFHIGIIILPLSFLLTPLLLNRTSDIVFEFISLRRNEEITLGSDLLCFAFAIIVLVVIYLV